MRVGVGGGKLDSHFIGLYGLLHAAGFVENISQVEIGEGVARIASQGSPVVFFGQSEVLTVVVKRSQVDVRGGVVRLKLEGFLVGNKGFGLGRGIFFERDAAGEPGGGIVLTRSGVCRGNWGAAHDLFASGEIQHELSGDRL